MHFSSGRPLSRHGFSLCCVGAARSSFRDMVVRSATKSELREFGDMLVVLRKNVIDLKKKGKSRDELLRQAGRRFRCQTGAVVLIDPDFFYQVGLRGRLMTFDHRENRIS